MIKNCIQIWASKKTSLTVLTVGLFLLWPSATHARLGGNLGVGFIAGQPSGINGKLWLGETTAIDGTLGFNVFENEISLNADYLWHDFELIRIPQGQMPLYYGMGLWTVIQNHGAFGVRGVVGVEYLFPTAPLDAFFEIAPGISILPGTDFHAEAGIGMRYFF